MGPTKYEEVSMSDGDDEYSNEDVETEDDDDEYSPGNSDDFHDTLAVREGVSLVLTRAGVKKPVGDIVANEFLKENVIVEALRPGLGNKDREDGEMMRAKLKRRRLLGQKERQRGQNPSWGDILGIHDWDGDSEDDDWTPIGAIKLRSHWFCANCTMPNWDRSVLCGKCGENRNSGILIEGHLASSTAASALTKSAVASGRDLSSRVFPMDPTEFGKTVIGFDERMLLHEETPMKPHPHPERPDRLRAIVAGLAAEGLYPGRCSQRPAREVTRAELELVHSREHVDAVEVTCNSESSYFTPDTYANKESSLAARIAAGISADLATAIVKGEIRNGFALVRPPGHHAEEVAVMGFCLHNNASVAARAAQKAGSKKVLIVDWDVHHGNGTQDIFEEDPSVLYVSLHRHDCGKFYPGTGAADEVGSGNGEGYSVNVPWICSGIGDVDYIFAFSHIVLPIAKQFAPDFTIISAGFDAAMGDPLGGCEVTPSGYAHMTSMLNSLSGGKMLVILEGGYNLRSISASASAVIKVLLGDSPGALPQSAHPSEAGAVSMLDVFIAQSKYWPCLSIPAILQVIAAKLASTNEQKKGKRLRRHRFVGGPVWWKWGRRRIVYYLWRVAGARRQRCNARHGAIL